MEYLNIHVSAIDGEAMQDAEAAEVRTWLFLMRYCAGQENGGRIEGARGWSDRKWLKLASLSTGEVAASKAAQGLWQWEGDDLLVNFYPSEQEKVLKAQRKGGSQGGKVSGRVRRERLRGVVEGEVEGNLQGGVERKGREGKEKEGKGKEAHSVGGMAARDGEENVPTVDEVAAWASANEVPEEYAREKWAETGERHGWMQSGRVLDWRRRWKRYWSEDREQWGLKMEKKARGGPRLNGARPAGWCAGDQEWWWTEDLGTVDRALTGALLGADEKNAGRLREVITARGKR